MHTSSSTIGRDAARAGTAGLRVAIAGATGYAGRELVRLLARHPSVSLSAAMGSAGHHEPRALPSLARVWDGTVAPLDAGALARADVVFLALPDAAAAGLVPSLAASGVRVIDLSGAFRLRDHRARARWYPEAERWPAGVVYGLTELERAAVARASIVANPGCYPTAAGLAIAPLAAARLLRPGADIVVDAKSGVSGAGKAPSERTHFCECHDSLSAYGIFNHRHAAEIEQTIGDASHALTFAPHLAPIDRGILATVYTRLRDDVDESRVGDALSRAYRDCTFVRLTGQELPEIKHVAHTNFCDIGWRVDGGRLVMVSVIDNLLKGAAGQAVQNMNLMLGLPEVTGLL